MSLLNRPSNGLHNVLLVLYRCVLAHGPLKVEKLIALCAPSMTAKGDRMPEKTLNTWKKLGLFTVGDDEQVRLSSELPKDARDLSRLTATLRGLVMDPRNNQKLWASDDDADDQADRATVLAEDFTRAACWSLMLSPLQFAGQNWKSVDTLQQEMFVPDSLAIQNDTRWLGFRAWAPFLGFGWLTLKGSLVPDPTVAIREVLPSIRVADLLPQREFLDSLARQLPILDGGSYRSEIESRLKPGYFETAIPGHLAPTLSLALQRLATAGVIEFQERADAERAVLTDATRKRVKAFTHVVIREVPG